MDSQPNEYETYNETILHVPKDLSGEMGEMMNLIGNDLKVQTKDERIFIGEFSAFDKFGNIVLVNAKEEFHGLTRKTLMVVIPLEDALNIAKKPHVDETVTRAEEKQADAM